MLEKLKKLLGLAPLPPVIDVPLAVQFGPITREVSDEEYEAIKAQRRQEAREWRALPTEAKRQRAREARLKLIADQKGKLQKIGVKQIEWIHVGGHSNCLKCAAKGGKLFLLEALPDGLFPGEDECCLSGDCHCISRAVILGFD